MKLEYLRRVTDEYYGNGWSVITLLVDAVIVGLIAFDYVRFYLSSWELGAVYPTMFSDESVDLINWRVFLFWILIIPFAVAASRTSWRKWSERNEKVHHMQFKWKARLRKILRFRNVLVVLAHIAAALIIAHAEQAGVTMQRLSGKSELQSGWGFQSYWATTVGFVGLFYATILVPAFQIALVKILGFRMGGISAHGLTGLTAEETPIKGLEHTHLSAHG